MSTKIKTQKPATPPAPPRIRLHPSLTASSLAGLMAETLSSRLDWASNGERQEGGKWVECDWYVPLGDELFICCDVSEFYREPDLRLPPPVIEEEVEIDHGGEAVLLSVRASLMSLQTHDHNTTPRRDAVYRVLIQSVE